MNENLEVINDSLYQANLKINELVLLVSDLDKTGINKNRVEKLLKTIESYRETFNNRIGNMIDFNNELIDEAILNNLKLLDYYYHIYYNLKNDNWNGVSKSIKQFLNRNVILSKENGQISSFNESLSGDIASKKHHKLKLYKKVGFR